MLCAVLTIVCALGPNRIYIGSQTVGQATAADSRIWEASQYNIMYVVQVVTIHIHIPWYSGRCRTQSPEFIQLQCECSRYFYTEMPANVSLRLCLRPLCVCVCECVCERMQLTVQNGVVRWASGNIMVSHHGYIGYSLAGDFVESKIQKMK